MELRKDYILNRYVIISKARGNRPREYKKEEQQIEEKICYFCPGNEHLTPPEISRVEKNGKWVIRVFPNKFPAVDETGFVDIKTDNIFFTYSTAFGKHEIVVEHPSHDTQLYDLNQEEIKLVLDVYKERIIELSKTANAKYVVLFKNHGREAGTSLVHTHTQIASINLIPPIIREKIDAVKEFRDCPYCKIIDIEKESDRGCFENNSFVAFTPYASRFNYEIWLFPKKHYENITELNEDETNDMAEMMVKILGKIKELGSAYNFILQYGPGDQNLHFHIEFLPRIATWAGFEFNSGVIINSVSPEDAAEFYRE